MATLVLGCAVAAPPAAGQRPAAKGGTLVSIVGSPVYSPVVHSQRINIRVPLAPSRGVAQGKLRAALLDVNLAGRGQKAIFDEFTLRMQHRSAAVATHRPRDLALVLGTTTPLSPGTYRIRAVVIDPTRGSRQRLSLQVRIATAVVAPPPVVHIKRTLHLWPFASETHAIGIPLHETSGRSRVTGLTIAQAEAPLGASGELQLTKLPVIPPGRTREARVETSGSFPLGSSTGKAQIDGRELAKPVDVTYEVDTAYGKIWLWALLLASVLLGYGARVGFTRVIQRARAKAQGRALQIRIARELARIEDQQFKEAISDLNDDLDGALGDDDPEAIEAAVKDAHDKLDSELKSLQTRSDAVTTRLSGIAAICAHSWSLPPAVGAALGDVREEIDAMNGLLAKHDVGGATERSVKLEQEFPGLVAGPAREWREAVLPFVNALRTPSRSAPGTSDPNVTQAAGAAYTAVTDPGLTRDDASAEDLLRATHAATGAVNALLQVERGAVDATCSTVNGTLSAAGATADELADIQRYRGAAGTALDAAAQQDAKSFAPAVLMLSDLGARLGVAIPAHLTDRDNAPAVQAALERGDFVAAAGISTQPQIQIHAFEGLMPYLALGAESVTSRTEAAFTGALQTRRLGPAPRVVLTRVVVERLTPLEELGIERRAARIALLGQHLLLGIAVLVVGYLLFVDAWTGTIDNVAAVFAWGFGANLTGQFVTEQLQKRTQPPSGTGTSSRATPPTTPDAAQLAPPAGGTSSDGGAPQSPAVTVPGGGPPAAGA